MFTTSAQKSDHRTSFSTNKKTASKGLRFKEKRAVKN